MSVRVCRVDAESTPTWYATCSSPECFRWATPEFDYKFTAQEHAERHQDAEHGGRETAVDEHAGLIGSEPTA